MLVAQSSEAAWLRVAGLNGYDENLCLSGYQKVRPLVHKTPRIESLTYWTHLRLIYQILGLAIIYSTSPSAKTPPFPSSIVALTVTFRPSTLLTVARASTMPGVLIGAR